MPKKNSRYILALLVITIFSLNGYGQVVWSGTGNDTAVVVDYNHPQKYEIGGITVSGIARFDQRMLLFKIGDMIEIPGDEIAKSIKKLWETGMYEDINISLISTRGDMAFLELSLKERARLVSFAFSGVSKSNENDIREKIKISQGNIVNDNLKITCCNVIKQYLIEKGYYNCSVTVKEEPDTKVSNGVNLFFEIHKGKKVRIATINIIGNQEVTKAQLTKGMKDTKEKSRFMPFYKLDTFALYMFKHPDYYASKDILEHARDYFSERVKMRIMKSSKFIEDKYETDKINLVNRYNELGYRDAKIEDDSIRIEGNEMIINIKVHEGKKYYFRDIRFIGNTKYNSDLLKQLLRVEKGDVYNLTQLNKNLSMNEAGTDISSLYMNDGYLFFRAIPVETLIDGDSIDMEIRINEGKQATYNKITISGNTKTNDNVILREVTTIPGQLFNRADIIRTQQVLLALGYFNQEKMNVVPKPNPEDGTVDIEYQVEETSSDQFELSAGYGSGSLLLSAGISFNNFSFKRMFKKDAWSPIPGGDGQRLALRISTNAIWYSNYSISFTEPWLGGKKPNSLSAVLYYQTQNYNGYKKSDERYSAISIMGVSLSLGSKLKWPDDYFQMSHTLMYQNYHVVNYSYAFVFPDGYANSISYTFALERNSVNAPIYPREGSNILFSVQLTPPFSLMNNRDYATLEAAEKYKWLEFHKWKFNISWFTRIVENFVLNLRLKSGFMGYYNPAIGNTPFERFYLGGDGLALYQLDGREVIGMRGYEDTDFTPTDGGTIYNKFTAELRYPITLNPSATIYMLAFAEAGNVWTNIRKYSPFSLYKSAGVGIRIHLPMFGLLGFDWGYGFDPLPGQTTARGGKFSISINGSMD